MFIKHCRPCACASVYQHEALGVSCAVQYSSCSYYLPFCRPDDSASDLCVVTVSAVTATDSAGQPMGLNLPQIVGSWASKSGILANLVPMEEQVQLEEMTEEVTSLR